MLTLCWPWLDPVLALCSERDDRLQDLYFFGATKLASDAALEVLVKNVRPPTGPPTGQSITHYNIAPHLACKQNLDLRCVLVPAPWVLGLKHV